MSLKTCTIYTGDVLQLHDQVIPASELPFIVRVSDDKHNIYCNLFCNEPYKKIVVDVDNNFQPHIVDIGLYFKCTSGSGTIILDNSANRNVQISTNGVDWVSYTDDISLDPAKTPIVFFKGNNPDGFSYYADKEETPIVNRFIFGTKERFNIEIGGNLMSLINPYCLNINEIPNTYCFYRLFEGNNDHNVLINASKLKLPSMILKQYCYGCMFLECAGLVIAPELPATILEGCCYERMFMRCGSLTIAPKLLAHNLVKQCYLAMFAECGSLNKVMCLASENDLKNNLSAWDGMLAEVGKNGTLYKWSDTELPKGFLPNGWTVKTV